MSLNNPQAYQSRSLSIITWTVVSVHFLGVLCAIFMDPTEKKQQIIAPRKFVVQTIALGSPPAPARVHAPEPEPEFVLSPVHAPEPEPEFTPPHPPEPKKMEKPVPPSPAKKPEPKKIEPKKPEPKKPEPKKPEPKKEVKPVTPVVPPKKTPPPPPSPKPEPKKTPPPAPKIEKKPEDEKAKAEKAAADVKRKQEQELQQKIAAELQQKRDAEQKAEKARQQKLLTEAQERMAKIDGNRHKIAPGTTSTMAMAAVPNAITSLQIDAIPAAPGAPSLSSKEVSYRDELAGRLKLLLRLPEFGDVKVKLTLDRTGKVVIVDIVSAESAANRKYIEKTLPGLTFPAFGSNFGADEKYTFSITLSNEL